MPYVVKDKILFLSSASKILSSSLDYNTTLVSIAKLIVDSVADFCMIDIFEEKNLKRVVVKMSTSYKNKLAQKFYDYPPDPKNKSAIYDAARLGYPIIIKEVTKDWLKTVSRIKEERDLVRSLGFSSLIFVPLISREKVIGVATLGSVQKNFSYSEEDSIFISEIAQRAAITVDKAFLFTKMQDALASREEFLAIASHELKTPLTSISLSLQLILRRLQKSTSKSLASEEILKAVETSIEQSKKMSRHINDLLDVSITTLSYFEINCERVKLLSLIEDIEKKFEVILKEKNVKLEIKMDKENIIGYWDRIRIEQAISNLISNAIKYGEGKPILLVSSAKKNYVLISIKDRGIGIKDEDKERIFKVFKRGTHAKSYKGIGVGLFLSKKIVEAHKGEISVESTPGMGSVFKIKLPLNPK